MSEATPFGRAGQYVLAICMIRVQRVIQSSDHSRGVSKRRVIGDLLHSLAVDPNLSLIVQAVEKPAPGVRQYNFRCDDHGGYSPLPDFFYRHQGAQERGQLGPPIHSSETY